MYSPLSKGSAGKTAAFLDIQSASDEQSYIVTFISTVCSAKLLAY